jgi:L-ribulose-5-phosphate 3-epimerase
MKKGINIWSFPSNLKIKDCIALAKKAGFDSIELALNDKGDLSLESSIEEVNGYRSFADEIGIELSSLATGLYWGTSLTSDSEETRKRAEQILHKQIDFAAALGVDSILVVPGAVGVDFIPDFQIVPYDIVYDRALVVLKKFATYAEEKKISIGLENVWNKFLLSPIEMRDFIDKVNSPFVGAYLDVGNVILTGYPEQWIKILGNRIKKVHFKDFRRSVGTINGFVDLLAGDVDFKAVCEALDSIGYDGHVTAEMIPNYGQYTDQIIYNTSDSMDRILGRL